MSDHIVWIVLFPMFGAVVCALSGAISKRLCYPAAIYFRWCFLFGHLCILFFRQLNLPFMKSHILGGWSLDLFPRGVGIEFRADLLGALITLVVTGVGLIVTLYSKVLS